MEVEEGIEAKEVVSEKQSTDHDMYMNVQYIQQFNVHITHCTNTALHGTLYMYYMYCTVYIMYCTSCISLQLHVYVPECSLWK